VLRLALELPLGDAVVILKAAVRKFADRPPWVQLALLGGALAVGINPRSRRAVLNSISPLIATLKEPAAALMRGTRHLGG
jgi:hypothetical protein